MVKRNEKYLGGYVEYPWFFLLPVGVPHQRAMSGG